jgi:two-component system response regulator RegA
MSSTTTTPTTAANAANEGQSVLLVDDDEVFRERLKKSLVERGFDVRCAHDVPSALINASADPPELAVVDLRMPGPSGLSLVDSLIALDPATRVVVLTGWGSVATAVEAMKRGAVHYLQKPVALAEVLAALAAPSSTSSSTSTLTTSSTETLPSLARQEWEYIHKVLGECDDNISEAARRLGLHRRSLQRKLQKLPPKR